MHRATNASNGTGAAEIAAGEAVWRSAREGAPIPFGNFREMLKMTFTWACEFWGDSPQFPMHLRPIGG
jgi:hypothetical protein